MTDDLSRCPMCQLRAAEAGRYHLCTLAGCPRCRLPVLPEFCGAYDGADDWHRYRVRQDTPAYVECENLSIPVDYFRALVADNRMIPCTHPSSERSN